MSTSKPLNDRESRFVSEYLASLNAMDAYVKAGYSAGGAETNAARLIRRDHIQAAIERGQARIRQKNTKTGDDVIASLSRIAFSGMSKFMRINADGEPEIDMSQCTADDLDLLAEVTVDTYMDGKGEDAREVKKIKIRPYSRMDALTKLAQHFGLLVPKGDREGVDRMAELMKELLDRGSALTSSATRCCSPMRTCRKPFSG